MKPVTAFLDAKFRSGKPRYCWACRCELTRGTATVDHLVPKSRGGKDAPSNFALACKPCNSKRGNSRLSKAEILCLKGAAKPKPPDHGPLITAIKRARA